MSKKKLTAKSLAKIGVPAVLIAGLLAAQVLGWNGKALGKIQNYYQVKALFPSSGIVSQVEDGDTFDLKSGQRIRLLGVNAPEGTPTRAENYLMENIYGKKVYLEYDRYQDDKYGRVLAWVWIDCESTPQFEPADYMHKSGNESMPGLTDNPSGCKKGKLVNEELVKAKYAEVVSYADRGELKYESRINQSID